MSLGILNNLSAVYAENNLNNTNSSLNTVLQQLSSGSKINSGADDAAGLSLVNGLQANQMALNQSETNATEGSGLLQVADGALSQVTSLLNRAVTLATESSNGTLNATQDQAANQEYQSILSEISNIGSTTTYNQEQVFDSNTAIYTGDSSTTGSSVDALNIRSLSSSNLGDSGGLMSYSSGSSGNNVFIDLTNNPTTQLTDGPVAGINDQLNASGTTSVTITTLSSMGTDVANVVSVGGTSGYANTAQGLIDAVNSQSQGWGVTASFTTAAVAGDTTAGTAAADTGIMITGSVGSGSSPSQSSFSGVVAAAGNTVAALTAMTGGVNGTAADAVKAGDDLMSGSITLQVGTNPSTTVTAAQVATANSEAAGAVTMAQLASYITTNAGLGVTATVNSSTGALDLVTSNNSTAALKVTSNLTDNTLKTGTASDETTSYTATSAYSAGVSTAGIKDSNIGNPTLNAVATTTPWTAAIAADKGVAQAAQELFPSTDTSLTGTLTITDAAGGTETLQLGSASEGTDTLAHLATTLNTLGTTGGTGGTSLGFTAALSAGGNLMVTQITYAGATNSINFATAANNTANTQTAADTVDTGGASTSGGIATISYTDKAGASLSGTDLSTQADAESALTSLNSAIADVAAQDGYIGAQINTLNAVSSVLATQSENVQSAQNAVQATDYASATSNMSKYEILSQTGIAALAQANSQQQDVLKLLQ
jgi:flagellin